MGVGVMTADARLTAPSFEDLHENVLVPSLENARAYRNALGHFGTGVTVITTSTNEGPIGMTVNSFASVSLEPALVLWSLSKTSGRFDAFQNAEHYSIHVMREDQDKLALEFAKNADAFETCDWRYDGYSVPLLNNALTRFDCHQQAVHDAGDHVIIVGQVKGVVANKGAPLIFAKGQFGGFNPQS